MTYKQKAEALARELGCTIEASYREGRLEEILVDSPDLYSFAGDLHQRVIHDADGEGTAEENWKHAYHELVFDRDNSTIEKCPTDCDVCYDPTEGG
jgi:hypothetical protein